MLISFERERHQVLGEEVYPVYLCFMEVVIWIGNSGEILSCLQPVKRQLCLSKSPFGSWKWKPDALCSSWKFCFKLPLCLSPFLSHICLLLGSQMLRDKNTFLSQVGFFFLLGLGISFSDRFLDIICRCCWVWVEIEVFQCRMSSPSTKIYSYFSPHRTVFPSFPLF